MGYLLLTGATGLLGRYLVADLLKSGVPLALLVRDGKHESAAQRVESIIQYWERQHHRTLPRPVVLKGDICRPYLGLSSEDIRWLSRNCSTMMHSAASLKFHDDGMGEPWKSNVQGTQHVLDLCKAADIGRLHYVSTAYVCGLRSGAILESDLDLGQDFRNDYEKSKLMAEKLVRGADHLDQLTVYRPAVISGDSKTGYTNTYHGIYLYLRMMAMLVPRQPVGPDGKRQTVLRLPVSGNEKRNVVPVDWVSQVMTRIFTNRDAHGQTYHIAPDDCLTARRLIEAGYTYFNSTGVQWVGYEEMDPSTYSPLEAEILPAMTMYHNYERTDPTFDCSNLKRVAGDIPCPVIDEQTLHTYIRYGEEDRWGKRRTPLPRVAGYAHCVVDQLPLADLDRLPATSVGLDIRGAGGGQWTLSLLPGRTVACSPGLAAGLESIVTLTTEEFISLTDVAADSLPEKLIEQFFPHSFARPVHRREGEVV